MMKVNDKDIHGGQTARDDLVRAVKARGGTIILVPLLPGYSTSARIAATIKEGQRDQGQEQGDHPSPTS